jgi:lipopolysaccharide/colanic/teichoic acid biosynthesis glycosyltransferase
MRMKRVMDVVLAGIALLVLAPLLVVVALAIVVVDGRPVFYVATRVGQHGRCFRLYKFRTMVPAHSAALGPGSSVTVHDDPRVTRIGKILRQTKLDELPQFLNVLRGEMSIVGPRPHALAAKAGPLLYQEAVKHYDSRHRVKPGITGWAQVNGWRGETNTLEQIRKRVEHDLYYIEHWSIALDLRIIARTVVGGFTGHNAF